MIMTQGGHQSLNFRVGPELTIFDSRSCKRPLKIFFLDNSNIMSSKAQGAKKASGSGGKDPGGGKKAPVGGSNEEEMAYGEAKKDDKVTKKADDDDGSTELVSYGGLEGLMALARILLLLGFLTLLECPTMPTGGRRGGRRR